MKKINTFALIDTPSLFIMLTWACFSILTSCVSKKNISKNEIKNDSINIETTKIRVDTIYKDRIATITEPIYNEIQVPCDSAKFSQSFTNGKIQYKVIKEKGQVKIVFKKDSSSTTCENQYKVLYRENNALKTQISSFKQTHTKEVVKKPFFANLWQILFFIVFILWILGITPLFLIKKFI